MLCHLFHFRFEKWTSGDNKVVIVLTRKSNCMNYVNLWTEQDFNSMDWHDCYIHAISFINDDKLFENKLCLDIDYILEWKLSKNETYCDFLVAPCNLIFEDVHNLEINIDTGLTTTLNLEIDNIYLLAIIERENNYKTKRWQLELQNGDIYFEAKGYKQIQRSEAKVKKNQKLSIGERGGINLSTYFIKL